MTKDKAIEYTEYEQLMERTTIDWKKHGWFKKGVLADIVAGLSDEEANLCMTFAQQRVNCGHGDKTLAEHLKDCVAMHMETRHDS